MKLSDLAKQVINEDSWGTWPSAGGGMSPGRSPTTTSAPATPNVKMVDVQGIYRTFKANIEAQRELVVKKFVEDLKKSFLNKSVNIKASKSTAGQLQKEYGIKVDDVDVRYMKDKYYIVFTGKEEGKSQAEYYLDDSVIQIDSTAQAVSDTGTTGGLDEPEQSTGNTKRNILPQK